MAMQGYRRVLAAGLLLWVSTTTAGLAYEGVIAPQESAPPAGKSALAPKSDGYSGVIVPSDGKIPTADNAGYGGYTPIERKPEMSLAPGTYAALPSPKSLEDLKMLSMIYTHDKDMDGVPDDLDTSFALPPLAAKVLAQPQYRENGMLPRELQVKRMIDYLLKRVKESKPGKTRQENIGLAEESLKSMQAGMRAKKGISRDVWLRMGVPDTYIKEGREGDEKSLTRIDAALEELAKYK